MNDLIILILILLTAGISALLIVSYRDKWFKTHKRQITAVVLTSILLGGSIIILDIPPGSPITSYGVIISGAVSTYEFDAEEAAAASQTSVCRVNNSQYYLNVCRGDSGSDGDGWARTLLVSNTTGAITASVISSYEYDDSDGASANVGHISGTDKYVVSYRDAAVMNVCTLQVWANNGTIRQSLIDSQALTYLSATGIGASALISVTANVWVVAYPQVTSTNLYLETLWIDTNGMINNTLLDIEEVDETYGNFPAMCLVDSDTIVITYVSATLTGDYTLATRNITSSGLIGNDNASSWEYETEPSRYSCIDKVGTNTFSVTYIDSVLDIQSNTVTISSAGAITASWIDTLEVVADTAANYVSTFVVHNSQTSADGSGILGLTYAGADDDGWMYTWNVTSLGVMPAARIGSGLEFNTTDNKYFAPVTYVNKSWYLIIYTDGTNDGQAATFKILTNYKSPTFATPQPTDGVTGVAVSPTCNITIADGNADEMTLTWYTNMTGSWVYHQKNSSCVNGTYRWSFTEASSGNTKYWWRVYANDTIHNVSATYSFTTVATGDTTPPTVAINFAGNLGDDGGPYYRPPGESDILDEVGEGVWRDGYYANNSYQSEDWIYINITATDAQSAVTNVWLNWANRTGTTNTWTNLTYAFTQRGAYWDYNTSGFITTSPLYTYSFDVVANSTGGHSHTYWNKTGLLGAIVRRYVHLNCTGASIDYKAFYAYRVFYTDPTDIDKKDRLGKDQSTDGTDHDTGMFRQTLPTSTMQDIWCSSIVGCWFDDNACVSPGTLTNIYYHFWWSNSENVEMDTTFWGHTRSIWGGVGRLNTFTVTAAQSREAIVYDGGTPYDTYHLATAYVDVTDWSYTDNSINEFIPLSMTDHDSSYAATLCNISIQTFVIFNVPSNATLNSSYADSDSDSLSDWYELYRSYTNPFVADTDADGVTDYNDAYPNNYTDKTLIYRDVIRNYGTDYMVWLGANISAYHVNLTLTGMNEATESISLWKRGSWSSSQGLWQTYNGTRTGTNWTVHTFDIIRTILDDAVGNQTVNMNSNPSWNYTCTRAIPLRNTSLNKGYNFSAYNRVADTTLSAINTSIGTTAGESVARWNRTTWSWDVWVSGFGPHNHAVSRWDVILTKMESAKTWNT